jgi:hypothetical protein
VSTFKNIKHQTKKKEEEIKQLVKLNIKDTTKVI